MELEKTLELIGRTRILLETISPYPWKFEAWNEHDEGAAGTIQDFQRDTVWAGPMSFWSIRKSEDAMFMAIAPQMIDELVGIIEEQNRIITGAMKHIRALKSSGSQVMYTADRILDQLEEIYGRSSQE